MEESLMVLPADDVMCRVEKIQHDMRQLGVDGAIVCDNANLFYLAGRVYAGFAYLPACGAPVWFVRRPIDLVGENVFYIRKPEDIPAHLMSIGLSAPAVLGLECDLASYNCINRLSALFPEAHMADISAVMRHARSVKTGTEIIMMRQSGIKHEAVYRRIPSLYSVGMTDLELQVEIERLARMEGCLGLFRVSGPSMEIFMGNIISGKNADVPTPYDFAMGGRGLDPSIPVGADGSEIKPNSTVMVDMNGNFTGYMTDMTRVFSVGEIPQLARDAHQCSIDICRMFGDEAKPGVGAKALYEKAMAMVSERGLEKYFMGHRQHAGFIGHGVGIEINELPVIAPRSKNLLEEGNAIALEPKFVIPDVGAVGIENTYIIAEDCAVCLTNAPEEIIPLI